MNGKKDSSPRSVLIVDDDAIFRQVLSMCLEVAGCKPIEAEHGRRAIELLGQSLPDVILLDMLMPVMDGMQLLRWLKEKLPRPIPTIVLTGLDRKAVVSEALLAGAADVLIKPFSLPVLLNKIATIS